MTTSTAINLTEDDVVEEISIDRWFVFGVCVTTALVFTFWSLTSPETKVKAAIYAACGLLAEVIFTGIKQTVRDRSFEFEGFTSLWAAPLYGSAALVFEPLYHALAHPHFMGFAGGWIFRGMIYASLIFTLEVGYLTFVFKMFRVVPWHYRGPNAMIRGRMTTDHALPWFLVGIGLERMADFFQSHLWTSAHGIQLLF